MLIFKTLDLKWEDFIVLTIRKESDSDTLPDSIIIPIVKYIFSLIYGLDMTNRMEVEYYSCSVLYCFHKNSRRVINAAGFMFLQTPYVIRGSNLYVWNGNNDDYIDLLIIINKIRAEYIHISAMVVVESQYNTIYE